MKVADAVGLTHCIKLQSIAEMLTKDHADAIGALLGAVVLVARCHSNPDEILAVAQDTLQQCRARIAAHEAEARAVAS